MVIELDAGDRDCHGLQPKKLSQYLGEGLGWLVANVSLVDITSAREVSGGGVCVEGSRRAVGGREAVAAGVSA
jgi:hypothetical protein